MDIRWIFYYKFNKTFKSSLTGALAIKAQKEALLMSACVYCKDISLTFYVSLGWTHCRWNKKAHFTFFLNQAQRSLICVFVDVSLFLLHLHLSVLHFHTIKKVVLCKKCYFNMWFYSGAYIKCGSLTLHFCKPGP